MTKTSAGRARGKKAAARPKTRSNARSQAAESVMATAKKPAQTASLQRWNVWLAAIFGFQAVAILLLSVVHKLPISLHFLAPDPLSASINLVPASRQLFEVNLVQLVAAFFLVAAVTHVIVATIYRRTYEKELEEGINRVRWFEYALSTSIMLIVMALLGGVYDLASLLMIFGLIVLAHLLDLVIELQRKGKRATEWTLWRIACAAGLLPWVVLGLYVFGTQVYGMTHLPGFVYWLYGSMAVIFTAFAVNHYLQHTKRGRWIEYIHGEKMYLPLSLIAKTALAWQVFAGVLRP